MTRSFFDYRETAKDLVDHSKDVLIRDITSVFYRIGAETPKSVTDDLLKVRESVERVHWMMWTLLNRGSPPPAEPTELAAIREILVEQVECDVTSGTEGSFDPHPSFARTLYEVDLRTSEVILDGFDADSIIPRGLYGVWKSHTPGVSLPLEFALKSIDLDAEKAVYAVTEAAESLACH